MISETELRHIYDTQIPCKILSYEKPLAGNKHLMKVQLSDTYVQIVIVELDFNLINLRVIPEKLIGFNVYGKYDSQNNPKYFKYSSKKKSSAPYSIIMSLIKHCDTGSDIDSTNFCQYMGMKIENPHSHGKYMINGVICTIYVAPEIQSSQHLIIDNISPHSRYKRQLFISMASTEITNIDITNDFYRLITDHPPDDCGMDHHKQIVKPVPTKSSVDISDKSLFPAMSESTATSKVHSRDVSKARRVSYSDATKKTCELDRSDKSFPSLTDNVSIDDSALEDSAVVAAAAAAVAVPDVSVNTDIEEHKNDLGDRNDASINVSTVDDGGGTAAPAAVSDVSVNTDIEEHKNDLGDGNDATINVTTVEDGCVSAAAAPSVQDISTNLDDEHKNNLSDGNDATSSVVDNTSSDLKSPHAINFTNRNNSPGFYADADQCIEHLAETVGVRFQQPIVSKSHSRKDQQDQPDYYNKYSNKKIPKAPMPMKAQYPWAKDWHRKYAIWHYDFIQWKTDFGLDIKKFSVPKIPEIEYDLHPMIYSSDDHPMFKLWHQHYKEWYDQFLQWVINNELICI